MENLSERVKRIASVLKASDSGPLLVAEEVEKIAGEWPSHHEAEGGVSFPQWIRSTLGRSYSLGYFQRRRRACDLLGKDVAVRLHHEAAVTLLGVALQYIPEIKARVSDLYRTQGRNCVRPGQLVAIVNKVTCHVPTGCKECETLRARVRELEVLAGDLQAA